MADGEHRCSVFIRAACCRSDGSIRAGAKLDRQSGSSVLALQHSGCGSLRGTKRTRLRSSLQIRFFKYQTSKDDYDAELLSFLNDCLACVAFHRKKKML